MVTCIRMQVVARHSSDWFRRNEKKPRREGRGVQSGELRIGSVAAVHQPPARAPGGTDQLAHIAAAAIAVAAAISAGEEAGTAPAAVKATMMPATTVPPAMPTPGRGGGRRQCGDTQRSRGHCNKREFAKHVRLLR